MRALFVCHDPPAPATDGGRIDMLGMLDSLARLGFVVDLLFTVRDAATAVDVDRLEQGAARLIRVERNTGLGAALALRPYQVASRAGLTTVALGEPYDLVVASDHTGNVFANPSLRCRWRVLRRNNDEALYARRMAADTRGATKLFFLKEAALFAHWTRRHDRGVDQVWYVSTEELQREAAAGEHVPSRVLVPSALGERGTVPPRREAIAAGRVLYFGSLTVPVNRAAVDWFVDAVHPLLRAGASPYTLTVAGRTTPAQAAWSARHAGRDDLTFLPNPADAAALYAAGGIFVDPLAHDAGIKLKILEAVRNGFPVVCHPASLFGSGLDAGTHARVATAPAEMAAAIAGLVADPDGAVAMATRARARLLEHFDIDRNIARALAVAGL